MTAATERERREDRSADGRTTTIDPTSPAEPGSPPGGSPTPSHPAPHPGRAIACLYGRLVRRGALLLAVALAAYAVLEVASYRSAYPDGISPVQFAMFEDNPAVRMINGAPYALDSAAGFALWDAGWIWQLILAVWAILITTRFLRGEEDLDRADLVLAGPVRAARVTGIVLAVVAAAGMLVGAVVAVTMIVVGQEVTSSVLLGMTLAGVSALFASVAAVTCQLVDVRRRAAGLAAAVLGISWIVRMIGDSTDPRAWLRWLTPLGWMEVLHLYGEPDPRALIPLLLAPVALAVVAVMLRTRRDIGAALLVSEGGREPRLRQLGSPAAFGWRSNQAMLIAWIVGVAAYAAVMGAIVSTMIDWLAGDEGYQRILSAMGMDQAVTNKGFLAFIATILGLVVALQVAWRLAVTRTEEESGRLEAILARPVTRLRWLGGNALLSLLGGTLLILVGGAAIWAGATAAGSSEITAWDAMRSTLNLLPIVALTAGLAIAAFGVLPRLTVALPVAVIVVGFVLSMLGPALDWPQWALDLSPFTHLALVPAEPWAATSGIAMTAIGIVLAIVGFVTFHRRDLTTA
jgi:ABC-2 type transport system permease protein